MKNKNTGDFFAVYVDDNFDFMDDSERTLLKSFPSYEEALKFCQSIVEKSVRSSEGSTAQEIYSDYQDFGDDPFIVAINGASLPSGDRFSAWTYAEEFSAKIADDRSPTQK